MIELQFINYILESKDKDLIVQNNITEEYFFDKKYKAYWKFIREHLEKFNIIPDKETFLDTFEDFEILDVKEPPEYLLEELYNNYKKNVVSKSISPKGDIGKAFLDGDIDALVSSVNKTAEEINRNTVIESVDIIEDTSRYDDYLDRIDAPTRYCVRTGLTHLDNALGGGWDRKEELATIVARTGVGKTWLALKFAVEAAKQGLNVGIYSGEMSENKVGYRIDTLLGNIPNGDLMHGNGASEETYEQYIKELKTKIPGHIRVLTPLKIGGPAGVNALRAFIEKDHLDMLIVDQHSLLEDDRHAKNPVEKASNISKDLKNLQVMEKIPIIAISQQNRTSTENGVGTEHVAQSDRIAQDSTTVLFLEREKEDKSILIIEIIKSRDNETGNVLRYQMDLNKGKFEWWPEGEDAINEFKDRYKND